MLCVDDMEDGGWRHKCRVHARNCKRFYTRRNRLVPSLCKCCASAVCTSVCGQCVVSVSTVSSGSSRTLLWNAHTHACASSCTLVRYIGIFSMGGYARVRVHCVRRIVAPASGSLPVNGWSRGGGKWDPLARRAAAAPPFSVLQTPPNRLNQHATESPSRCRSPALMLRVWSRGGALPRVVHPSWRWRKYTGHSRRLGPRTRPLQRDSPRLPAPLASCPLAAWCSAVGGKAKSVCHISKSHLPPPRY